jgi:hypothetical protein
MMPPMTTREELRGSSALDPGAREALLRLLIDRGVEHATILKAFFRRDAYGGVDDYLAAVRSARGFEAAETIRAGAREMTERYIDHQRLDWEAARTEASRIYGPIGFLVSMPEADLLTALEAGGGLVGSGAATAALSAAMNEVCDRRGLSYSCSALDGGIRFQWRGDAAIAEVVVAPVMSALADPRLADGAGVEFDGAREQLRQNTRSSRKRAVGEACSAVESAMCVLLEQHGKAVPKPRVLTKLVKALTDEAIVERELPEILQGAGFFGNRKGRHGAGPVAHDVDEAGAEAAVAAAAVAITYLARRLPPAV